MGVKNSMNTFFSAMQGQNSSGYGGRLVNTPMGPFRWDDNYNMWINVNNGMALSNISFQDEFAIMMNYDTLSGSSNDLNLNITTVPWSRNDYTMNVVSFTPATVSITANVLTGSTGASNILTISGNTLPAYLIATSITGPSYVPINTQIYDFTLTYKRNSGIVQTSTLFLNSISDGSIMPGFPPGQSFAASNTIQLFVQAKDWFIGSATYGIQLYNPQNGNTYVSDVWYVGMNVPARTASDTLTLPFGTISGATLTNSGGYTLYANLLSQNLTSATDSASIQITGNNVPIKIRTNVTKTGGVSLANVIGSASVISGTDVLNYSSWVNMETTGFTAYASIQGGLTAYCGRFWIGLVLPTTPGLTGSGSIQLYNDTAGSTISTALPYSFIVS